MPCQISRALRQGAVTQEPTLWCRKQPYCRIPPFHGWYFPLHTGWDITSLPAGPSPHRAAADAEAAAWRPDSPVSDWALLPYMFPPYLRQAAVFRIERLSERNDNFQ